MSEHIQSAPDRRDTGLTSTGSLSEEHARTPGVAHESEAFDFRLILWAGACLVLIGLVVHFAVLWLLEGFERSYTIPPSNVSELVKEETTKPIGQRVENVPGPHLEGIERESSLLEILTEDGVKQRFVTSADVHVRIGKNEKARLFELHEGQRVTLTYYMPGGAGGGLGVVTSITSPPIKAEPKKPGPELSDVSQTLNGVLIKIEPRSIAAERDWAEVQMGRYGWVDRDKGIVHIPVEKAMEEVLRRKEFGSPKQGRERTRPKKAGDKR